jgi:hypothetical protein
MANASPSSLLGVVVTGASRLSKRRRCNVYKRRQTSELQRGMQRPSDGYDNAVITSRLLPIHFLESRTPTHSRSNYPGKTSQSSSKLNGGTQPICGSGFVFQISIRVHSRLKFVSIRGSSLRPFAVQISPTRIQAAKRSGSFLASSGTFNLHAGTAKGQRGWKLQPAGGFRGDGGSPCKIMR